MEKKEELLIMPYKTDAADDELYHQCLTMFNKLYRNGDIRGFEVELFYELLYRFNCFSEYYGRMSNCDDKHSWIWG